jgi:hypothetical protein
MYRFTFSLHRQKLEVIGQLHAPAALSSAHIPWFLLDRRMGGPQSRSRRNGECKILDPTGTRNYDPSLIQLAQGSQEGLLYSLREMT